MKKKLLLVLLVTIATISLVACNSKNQSHIEEPKQEAESTELISVETTIKEMAELEETNSITEMFDSQEITNISVEETTEPESETVLPLEGNEDQTIETTDLFEQIYVPYANREKSFIFNSVKSFVSTLEYKVEISEPTEEDLGEIKVIDINGDYVYFAFSPINDVQTIMIVSYYRAETGSEVSMDNYSFDGSPLYDNFTTHILGESNIEVSSTDEQRNFLFKKEDALKQVETEKITTVEQSREDATQEVIESFLPDMDEEEKELSEPFNDSTKLISEHRTDKKIIGVSNKDISDLNLKFYENVENDVSGRWRLAEISEDVDIQNYIYSYYKEYFKDDSEFHVIVNHSRKITTNINPVREALYVVEHNYVEDAKRLCAKPVIKEYYIYTDNGDIEKLE